MPSPPEYTADLSASSPEPIPKSHASSTDPQSEMPSNQLPVSSSVAEAQQEVAAVHTPAQVEGMSSVERTTLFRELRIIQMDVLTASVNRMKIHSQSSASQMGTDTARLGRGEEEQLSKLQEEARLKAKFGQRLRSTDVGGARAPDADTEANGDVAGEHKEGFDEGDDGLEEATSCAGNEATNKDA
ncbi:uncharacterized protein K460DRAFT_406419 [Cucurbitaria berberidis CBS 394.84]|uniref:Uncharacterized protein n=1 Tax=Cucurbitaria berberidis CBS 394.84 TaxID=1168544 RepID=A0A9P4GID0_9PLEO|nr:uncharacterized protein K460DRAFT_406419 [Cucurbitaria berberidis CBS 394.84]KAF1846197.1 hypothetical protein K460DRAFT_406419 [Cucurbitaria berberidis CBS 394.84]